MTIYEWSAKHKPIYLLNQRVSFIDTSVGENVILVIHGFGTSSYDYHKVIDELKLTYRMVIPDLVGFGLSSKPINYYFSIIEQAQILLKLLESLNIKEVSVIAQGFGASVLCELMNSLKSSHFTNLKFHKIWLLNFSLSVELSPNIESQELIVKYINSTFLKISSSFEIFKKYIRKSFYNGQNISDEELNTSWELLKYDNGLKTLQFIDYWIIEIQQSSNRWLEAIKNSPSTKYVIWGIDDSSGDTKTLESIQSFLNTENSYLIEKCGYLPMLENPEAFIKILKSV